MKFLKQYSLGLIIATLISCNTEKNKPANTLIKLTDLELIERARQKTFVDLENIVYKNEKGTEYVKANIENLAAQSRLPYDDQFLNYFGYEFLFAGKEKIAIQLFTMNTELFSEIPNTFDSLAEGYLISGDTLNALKYYNLVLQKDPSNKLVEDTISNL